MSDNIKGFLMDELEAIDTENPHWNEIEKEINKNKNYIYFKEYNVDVLKGCIVHKKIRYSNIYDRELTLVIESNFPKILFLKTKELKIEEKKNEMIRMKIFAPDSTCRMEVKVAVIDKFEKVIKDCLIFNLNFYKK